MPKIAVIGAGVVGISTATLLQDTYPDAQISIFADRFTKDTTSHGAAGIYRPNPTFVPGVDRELFNEWCATSFNQYHKLVNSPIAKEAGAASVSGYQVYSSYDFSDPVYKEFVYQYHRLSNNEVQRIPGGFKSGYFMSTLIVECRKYLPYLTREFTRKGGKVFDKHVNDVFDFCGDFDVVANCTGLGASSLCNDKLFTPVRGQMVRVIAPWLKHFYYSDEDCYIIPGVENVILGGTRQKNNTNLAIDPVDRRGILERAGRLCPSLTAAPVDEEWVGLRPERAPPRIEVENVRRGNERMVVLHNYGHGASGVTLSWGTSVHAVRLLKSYLETTSKL